MGLLLLLLRNFPPGEESGAIVGLPLDSKEKREDRVPRLTSGRDNDYCTPASYSMMERKNLKRAWGESPEESYFAAACAEQEESFPK